MSDGASGGNIFGGSPYSGGYSGGNVVSMFRQFNGQMAAVVEGAFIFILLVLVYYLYNGKEITYNMKVAGYVIGGVYLLNEFLVYQGKAGGVYGMVAPVFVK